MQFLRAKKLWIILGRHCPRRGSEGRRQSRRGRRCCNYCRDTCNRQPILASPSRASHTQPGPQMSRAQASAERRFHHRDRTRVVASAGPIAMNATSARAAVMAQIVSRVAAIRNAVRAGIVNSPVQTDLSLPIVAPRPIAGGQRLNNRHHDGAGDRRGRHPDAMVAIRIDRWRRFRGGESPTGRSL